MYKLFIRPLLFLLSPETIHGIIFATLKIFFKIPGVKWKTKLFLDYQDASLEREVFGLKFKNPVGLAAGLDKDAEVVDALACMGFGFIEIGTLTPVGQPGNPQPRLFRLKKDKALINRMGFNNEGAKAAAIRLKKRKSNILVGGNIGKNKVTANVNAWSDYEQCYNDLHKVVDYFAVNVSSPNTPNLRALQEKEPLKDLLSKLQALNKKKSNKPILLKIAPDLTNEQLDDIIEIVKESKIAGVIATNTTIEREPLSTKKSKVSAIGTGGLSGKPVTSRSTEVIRYLHDKSNAAFPIIGVGGIFTGKDAEEKLKAGASLVQVYTGFIYEGPAIAKKINKYLVKNNVK